MKIPWTPLAYWEMSVPNIFFGENILHQMLNITFYDWFHIHLI